MSTARDLYSDHCACGKRIGTCSGTTEACKRSLPPVTDRKTNRTYFDSWTTSQGPYFSSPPCEHCDGERSRYVRNDSLRGWVCPPCDASLDEMFSDLEDAS